MNVISKLMDLWPVFLERHIIHCALHRSYQGEHVVFSTFNHSDTKSLYDLTHRLSVLHGCWFHTAAQT